MQNLGIFFPVPTFWMGYFLMWLPPDADIEAFTLPTRRGFVLSRPAQLRQGAAATHRSAAAPPPQRLARGTSLVQLPDEGARRQKRCLALQAAHDLARCHCVRGELRCPDNEKPTAAPPAHAAPTPDTATVSGPPVVQPSVTVPALSVPTPLGRRTLPSRTPPSAERKQLCLQDLVPAQPPAHTAPVVPSPGPMPSPDSIITGWAIDADIAAACLGNHCLTDFHSDLSPLEPDLQVCTKPWLSLPVWDPGSTCDELFLFPDGSYYPGHPQATWAVAAAVRQGSCVARVGVLAGEVTLPRPGIPSAYHGEVEALLHAAATACLMQAPIVHIGSDCEAALTVASGRAAVGPSDPSAAALVSLIHCTRIRGVWLLLHKIAAHTGCAFNDLADAVAKQVGRSRHSTPWLSDFTSFHDAVCDRVHDRLWLTTPHVDRCMGIPALLPNGTWSCADTAQPTQEHPDLPIGFVCEQSARGSVKIPLRILQYNVLSLKGVAARTLIAKGLDSCEISVAGFQETRELRDGFSTFEGWWVLSASCDAAGIGGAQIWINPRQTAVTWDRQALSIHHSAAQCIIVLARANGLDLALVSAHAPPSTSPRAVLDAWWSDFQQALRGIPARYVVLSCIDANARFLQKPEGTADSAIRWGMPQLRLLTGNSACHRG